VDDYYTGIVDFLEHAVRERFVREDHRAMLMVDRDPRRLIDRLREFEPQTVQPKWIDRGET
jgi:predicted Rossmann-fold nucleotide-binding protein